MKSHQRRSKTRGEEIVNESGLRFDTTVPVETIEVINPHLENLPADSYDVIDEKVTVGVEGVGEYQTISWWVCVHGCGDRLRPAFSLVVILTMCPGTGTPDTFACHLFTRKNLTSLVSMHLRTFQGRHVACDEHDHEPP